MQKVAAYLLERREGVDTQEKRTDEVKRLLDVLQAWLQSKGAKELATDAGTFISENGKATFRWERAVAQERSWRVLRLDEVSGEGKTFSTAVSVTDTGAMVAVYVSLEAGLAHSTVAPISIQPKCPRFLRAMLDLSGDWHHGTTKIYKSGRVTGEESGKWLAQEILIKDRTLPILVISEDEGKVFIPKLDEKLAYDLAGLANVFIVDHDAAWGLTEILGKSWSCYWGAIRLYWPRVDLSQDPYFHPIWTPNKILGNHENLNSASERFREQLRGMLMDVSALSVVRPREIDEIRSFAAMRQIAELEKHAISVNEFRKLAEEFATENDRLRLQCEKLREELIETQTRLQNAQEIARFQERKPLTIEPEKAEDQKDERPRKGEIRFYKKTHSTGPYDVLVRVPDCGHNKWQGATKADKARAGVARLEKTREWTTFWHCGSCQGGGMWKVKW